MQNLQKLLQVILFISLFSACTKNEKTPAANNLTLHFNNTFKDKTIVLGDKNSTTATVNTSASGQVHRFSELKYVISNIRLVTTAGKEVTYNINDLDKGATIVDHSKPQTLDYVLTNIPSGEYKQLKFGLGVKQELNTLDEVKFPKFYAAAGANKTWMMWEWGTGYRFTKIEGFYDTDNKQMSIHTGSTVDGKENDPSTWKQGVDAYRDITLPLSTIAVVGFKAPKINIKADFDKLLSGKTNTIKLKTGNGMEDNATPNIHHSIEMRKFVDNLGGNGTSDITGIFSVTSVEN